MLIDGVLISNSIKEELKLKTKGLGLSLAIIQVGDNKASNIYVSKKMAMAEELDIKTSLYKFDSKASFSDIEATILSLNESSVNGIFIQLPLSDHLDSDKLINLIDPSKDVDGLTSYNFARLNDNDSLVPCTPKGILKLFEYSNIDLVSKDIVIVGKSKLVGLPLAFMLLKRGATVTVCHSKTLDLGAKVKGADIVISAAGVANLITADMIKEGAVVIDVGINSVKGKMVGDVDFENVSEKASLITPVPGGVGPMTVVMLMENVYLADFLKKN